ncbi:hypothetical protein RhiJN_06422 [Ceratobasidium sp. AG-Ba]|nr:hypothetical protein RhiJN_06422 [Ceratobasidium sp. AG-Ba]
MSEVAPNETSSLIRSSPPENKPLILPTLGLSPFYKWLRLRPGVSSKLSTCIRLVMIVVFIIRVPYIFPNGFELNLTRASVLPAGLLAITQFVPRIRARAVGFHRTAGKIINILTVISTISAWGIARVSLGGDLATQLGLYALGAMVLWSTTKAWVAIRRLQIDEHRRWMIRAWSYHMSIVTLRFIIVVAMVIITAMGGFYQVIPCDEIAYTLNNTDRYAHDYPQCQEGWNGSRVTHVAIEANIEDDSQLGVTAALQSVFGMSTWVGLWIHAIITEYYLFKTKEESDRLLEVSMKRQNARRALIAEQGTRK